MENANQTQLKLHSQKIHSNLRAALKSAKAKGYVLGVSGGVDSAVVLALCAKAVGSPRVTALLMPSSITSKKDAGDAQFLCKKFRVKSISVPIAKLAKDFAIASNKLGKSTPVEKGNSCARIRMALLYDYARKHSYLVAGTGDKSEIMLGYFTKFGDGGVDILPLGSLYKTEVQQLALQLGIPKPIAFKQPSPNLWKNQTAEKEIGAKYSELDSTLKMLEKKIPLAQIKRKVSPRIVSLVLGRMKISGHKKRMPPVL
ncbi:putative NH(3)-dependent NAD(+) synthetase [Candidatus Gugararchaeum adminiculabundum]|nr:putative NH(3)-dependent NAD(+) synthetase [Candidatus Gugararchaeum adminiculabundum]